MGEEGGLGEVVNDERGLESRRTHCQERNDLIELSLNIYNLLNIMTCHYFIPKSMELS